MTVVDVAGGVLISILTQGGTGRVPTELGRAGCPQESGRKEFPSGRPVSRPMFFIATVETVDNTRFRRSESLSTLGRSVEIA
jgi:hypothetical protein